MLNRNALGHLYFVTDLVGICVISILLMLNLQMLI